MNRVLLYIFFYAVYYITYKLAGFEQTMLIIGATIVGDLIYNEIYNDRDLHNTKGKQGH